MSSSDSAGGWRTWGRDDAREWIAVPSAADDKYSRGVLGILTGSDTYPGAAVLGVDAAARAGVGMVRYLGPPRAADFVLRRRPEVVTAAGRVQAWLIGSGMDARTRKEQTTVQVREAIGEGVPCVLDAGALDLVGEAAGPTVITPHYRELAGVLKQTEHPASGEEIRSRPAHWAQQAAEMLSVAVLLKGHTTYVAAPGADRIAVVAGTSWLATAGTGDVLAGIVGSLVATHTGAIGDGGLSVLARLAASASVLHSLAAERASGGGPVTAIDVAEALPATIAELLAE